MCAALILGPRLGGEPEQVVLNGQTERGQAIQMVLYDGKLHSFETEVAVWCPSHRTWTTWTWFPSDGLPVDFKHDGSRFYVREESTQPQADQPVELIGVMRGELGDGDRSATGTITSRATWGNGPGAVACSSTLGFSARERQH